MKNLTRRFLIVGGAVMMMAMPLPAAPRKMTADQAHDAAKAGDILLLDIRTRGEWRQTGIGAGAHAVSMHEPDFLARLYQLTGGDKTKPVALICAVGGRSLAVQKALARMGYSEVIDVAEGMIGGVNGPGWIKSGLPMKTYPHQ